MKISQSKSTPSSNLSSATILVQGSLDLITSSVTAPHISPLTPHPSHTCSCSLYLPTCSVSAPHTCHPSPLTLHTPAAAAWVFPPAPLSVGSSASDRSPHDQNHGDRRHGNEGAPSRDHSYNSNSTFQQLINTTHTTAVNPLGGHQE